MSEPVTTSEARERVLAQAERLFSARGYDSVTLREIAGALGIKQASLYHHAPGGKEELYVAVMERGLRRHRAGFEAAIATGGDIATQLRAAARWLLSQPPLNLSRMVQSDLPAIDRAVADRLIRAMYEAVLAPVERALRAAEAHGEIVLHADPTLTAAAFVTMIGAIRDAGGGRPVPHTPDEMAGQMIAILLDGLRPRP